MSQQCMPSASPCPGCGFAVAGDPVAPHAYLSASPGCWARFNESLALHYGDARYWPAHQTLVDAYALQHSVGSDRRAVRSAYVHLAGLYGSLELDLPEQQIVRIRQQVAKADRRAPIAPWPTATASIADVCTEESPAAHLDSTVSYGRAVLRDWADHRQLALALCDSARVGR